MSRLKVVLIADDEQSRHGLFRSNPAFSLAPRGATTLFQHYLQTLQNHGFRDVAIVTNVNTEITQASLRAQVPSSCRTHVIVVPPYGGRRDCLQSISKMRDPLLVIGPSIITEMDYSALWERHKATKAIMTVVACPSERPMDCHLIQTDRHGLIVALNRKPHECNSNYRNLNVPGIFIAEPEALNHLLPTPSADTAEDLIEQLIEARQPVFAYRTTEYLENCSSTDLFDRITEESSLKQVHRRYGKSQRPAMFIDRDGTLNRDVGHIYHPDQIQLLPGAAAAVRALNRAGVLAVVITNQAVLARGLCSFAEFQQIQGRLEMELGAEGAFLDGTFFCPHYPIRGYPGEVTSLKVECGCRKPKAGLVIAACRELPIDLGRSVVVGDSTRDIELADQLKLPSYWISPPTQTLRCGTMRVASLQDAVSHWLCTRADRCCGIIDNREGDRY